MAEGLVEKKKLSTRILREDIKFIDIVDYL
jgi:hypothetical protein